MDELHAPDTGDNADCVQDGHLYHRSPLMNEVEINSETVASLGTELARYIEKYGAKHRDLKVEEALSALMHTVAYLVGTTASRTGRENLVANVKRLLPDLLDRTLKATAEVEAEVENMAEPAVHVH
jgi:hypothetical protein